MLKQVQHDEGGGCRSRNRESSYIPNNFASDFSSMKNCQISRP